MGRGVVALAVAGLVLAGCGSANTDPWREVAVPGAAGDTAGQCGPVGVMDVPAGWKVEPPNRTYKAGALYIKCVITTGKSEDGTLEVYDSHSDTVPPPRQVIQDGIDPGNDPTNIDIRDLAIGTSHGAEATWTTGYQNRAFVYRVESTDRTMLIIATGAKAEKYDEVLLPAYLLARKSIHD
ncbi:lipoprotein [Actinokineospora terrae]|uniref:Uncharacterized protein n=1 Tax=Actinokineospora terrae TaxID=155974 RepID=A0A1H9WD58_9PSEU|nr:lipoprotein [Actinokineospora terrae]SES31858.1 hypothetical protein SAMN04487818_11096 [Actinokineospora terrae]